MNNEKFELYWVKIQLITQNSQKSFDDCSKDVFGE